MDYVQVGRHPLEVIRPRPTFGVDRIPHVDPGSLFHFPYM